MTNRLNKILLLTLSITAVLCAVMFKFGVSDIKVSADTINAENGFYIDNAEAYVGSVEKSGIRFKAIVDESRYNEIIGENPKDAISFGMLIAPECSALTVGTESVMDVVFGSDLVFKSGKAEYLCAIYYDTEELSANIQASTKLNPDNKVFTQEEIDAFLRQAYSKELSARPYYKINDSIVYGTQTKEAKSIRNIINSADVNGIEVDKEILDKYLTSVTKISDEEIYFDASKKKIIGYSATSDETYLFNDSVLNGTVIDGILSLEGFTPSVGLGEKFVISAFDNQNNVKRITVQNVSKVLKTADDITELFGEANKANHLDGYYVLGNDIDASTANVKGALRFNTTANDKTYGEKSQFVGTFDGKGYVISNLDISGNYKENGSLFGQMTPKVNTLTPTVKNVAFKNVKASYAGVISSYATYNAVRPILENIYISVSKDTQNFRGMALNSDAIIKNVIVEYPNEEYNNGLGAFVSGGFTINNCSNCYLISKTYIKQDDSGNEVLPTASGKVTRYESLGAMKAAENDYSSFSASWWNIIQGIPVWHSLNAKDDSERAVSVTDGTIDLEGLNFTIDQISEIEIAGTKYPITNGKLPSMALKGAGTDKLLLTIENDQKINIAKQPDKQDFDAVEIAIKLSDNTIYELTNVQFYTKVLKTPEDITELFGAANKANHLDGYYVLGNNIDASTANVKGALRFNTMANDKTYGARSQFVGIFDGKGYTISNLDISGTSRNNKGSLFGQMSSPVKDSIPTVRNVAFVNIKASYAAIISTYVGYNANRPEISNVYVSVSQDTTNFLGFADNSSGIIKNVIVEYPNEEHNNGFGAFLSENSSLDSCSNCYLISKTYIKQDDSENEVLPTASGKITRYESLEAMKAAIQGGVTLTGFNYCWVKDGDGMVVWKALNV